MAANSSPTLEERVEVFVQWLFQDFKTTVPKRAKVFNDALLGNQLFSPHEVAVIDSPVFQRLKRIKQLGLVHHVFPSATHSRFEHSLGAASIAERCFDAIAERTSVEHGHFQCSADRFTGDLAHLRMAALLHDVGHGLCSHASEQIYEQESDLREFTQKPAYAKNAPGEILSYLIVKSPTFVKWFEEVVVHACSTKLDLDIVANLILGRHPDQDLYFLGQILSSSYDCDKLDYIARDSYYCGLALTVDLARFYSMLSTAKQKGSRVLVLRNYVPLEQILFSKATLIGSVYQHQKVKCLDSMLRSMIQHVIDNPGQCGFKIRGATVTFADPIQYLYVTDDEFFGQADGFGDPYIKDLLRRFRSRDLFVRCLEISRRTLTAASWESHARLKLLDLAEVPERLKEAEDKIHTVLPPAARGASNRRDVRLSVPKLRALKTGNALIQTTPQASIEHIEDYFPVEQWQESYAHNKWRSYVYAPNHIAKEVRDAALDVLKTKCELEFEIAKSDQTCHL